MTTNIKEFLNKFNANAVLALKASENATNDTILTMYKHIVEGTPVGNPALWHPPYWPKGYVPGTLKKSWQINFNNQQRNLQGQFASSAQTLTQHGLTLSLNDSSGKTVSISNPQPYAQRVEEGWSSQAPYGMMRTSVAEFKGLIESNAVKYRK